MYANLLGRVVLVPSKSVTSLGSAIFAFLAAGIFRSVEEAQDRICPPHTVYEPQLSERKVYDELYAFYSELYFSLGRPSNGTLGAVLPKLIEISSQVRSGASTTKKR